MNNKILYLSYDGISEPIGNSQVLSYIEKLSIYYDFYLVTFEKKKFIKKNKKNILSRINKKNINWFYFYFRNSNSVFFKLLSQMSLFFLSFYLIFFKKIKVIHIRSYVPGITIFFLKKFFNIKIIFDIRGFWLDERVDRLNWNKKSLKYFLIKKLENYLFNKSDIIVTLTNQSKNILTKKYKFLNKENIFVIYTSSDEDIFNISKFEKEKKYITFGYIGSIDTAYSISVVLTYIETLFKFISNLKIKFYVSKINELQKIITKFDIRRENYEIYTIDSNKMPEKIKLIDFGIFNLKNNYSIKASFPTKISELFLSGIPIICNNFNDDIEQFLSNNQVGLLTDFSVSKTSHDVQKIQNLHNNLNVKKKCRDVGLEYLSLNRSCKLYVQIYKKIFLNLI